MHLVRSSLAGTTNYCQITKRKQTHLDKPRFSRKFVEAKERLDSTECRAVHSYLKPTRYIKDAPFIVSMQQSVATFSSLPLFPAPANNKMASALERADTRTTAGTKEAKIDIFAASTNQSLSPVDTGSGRTAVGGERVLSEDVDYNQTAYAWSFRKKWILLVRQFLGISRAAY
jgi:hypothetical protein